MRNEKGFTLIELVMVIVLLGILAAVAIPKFINLQNEAALASANGIYGAARSAAVINFASNRAGKGLTLITNALTLTGAMESTPDGCSASGGNLTCTINNSSGYIISISSAETSGASPAAAVVGKSW